MATVLTTTYGTPTTVTIDLSSLAESATWVAGRESNEVDNSSNLFVDVIIDNPLGIVATPTATGQELRVYCWGQETAASASAISTLVGVDAARTISLDALQALRLGALIGTTAASGTLTHYFSPFSVASLFGGVMPKYWGIYVAHNIGTADLGATQSAKIRMTGIKYTST